MDMGDIQAEEPVVIIESTPVQSLKQSMRNSQNIKQSDLDCVVNRIVEIEEQNEVDQDQNETELQSMSQAQNQNFDAR